MILNQINNMNETWFSNQLAWLLDPKGSHSLNSEFSNSFFTKVLGDKFIAKNFNLDNFEVCREFYVQVDDDEKSRDKQVARRLDVVFMDLEQKAVVVIENKFDGMNHRNQLSEYLQIKKLFTEDFHFHFIYLTRNPNQLNDDNINEENKELVLQKYIQATWTEDIEPILELYMDNNYEIFKLRNTLARNTIENDFDVQQVLSILKFIGVEENKTLIHKDAGDDWTIKDKKLKNSYSGQDISVYIQDKSIQISYSNKKNVKIQRGLSNKQIIYYLIHVMYKFYDKVKTGTKNAKRIEVNAMYNLILKQNNKIEKLNLKEKL